MLLKIWRSSQRVSPTLCRYDSINITNTSSFDTSKYKFTLNVQNTTNVIVDVTTADFEVPNTETGTTEETLDFFPPNRLTGENILIVKLKPNPGGKGEKVHLEGTAVIGNGAMNARFSPTSAVMYVNQIDPKKVEAAMTKYIVKHRKVLVMNQLIPNN